MLKGQAPETAPSGNSPAAVLGVTSTRSGAQDATIRLEGELDIYTAGDLKNRFLRLPESCTRLVIDLSQLRFIDCAGLRLVSDIQDELNTRQGHLTLQGAPRRVRRIFKLAGLDSEFDFVAAECPEGPR